MKEIPKCQYCDNDCIETGAPWQFTFGIPFTKIEIVIWNWAKRDYLDVCESCNNEINEEPYDGAYKQGVQDGYDEARNDPDFINRYML